MHNDSKTISAGEINKFIYCPYQWYYTRLYGSDKLRELVKERNKNYGYENITQNNFDRGNRFHAQYHRYYKIKNRIKFIFLIICAIAIAAIIIWVMQYE
nr:PD-(D/E)XK nuclease family protein [Defluviitalea phaphyphila]